MGERKAGISIEGVRRGVNPACESDAVGIHSGAVDIAARCSDAADAVG